MQRDSSGRDAVNVQCERCGRFNITSQAISGLKPEQKSLLSAFCRRASSGNNVVKILSTNIEELISSLPKFTPAEKLDNLLELLGERTAGLGAYANFQGQTDYPLLVLQDSDEVDYLLRE